MNDSTVLQVTCLQACFTHEAAISTVDKKELETLMTLGLGEERAFLPDHRGVPRATALMGSLRECLD